MSLEKKRISFLIISFLVLVTATADLPATYTLAASENEHFRSYTFEELASMIGTDREFLSEYLCDEKKEFQLFTELFRSNPKGDSLQIKDEYADERIYYKEGHFYSLSGEELPKLKRSYFRQVAKALEKLEGLPSGQTLLRRLEVSPHPLVISYEGRTMFNVTTGNRYETGIDKSAALVIFELGRKTSQETIKFNQIGSGGVISWRSDIVFERIEKDGVKREVPSYLALGHEMYHAFDSIRGLLDVRRSVIGRGYENSTVSEYRAVYFENQLRKEAGVRILKRYGVNEEDNGDMLDAQGNPFLIPSACLKSLEAN